MIQKEVSAKVPAKDGADTRSCTIVVNFAENVKEAEQMFGEEAILTNAFASWRVTLQANIRGKLKQGLECGDIQDLIGSSVMGVTSSAGKVDPQTAFIARFKSATPEEQENLLEMLKNAAQ